MNEKVYPTLQAFFQSIGLPLEQDTELTIHPLKGLHGDKPIKSPLFRTNYFTIVLVTGGKSTYIVDNHTFPIARGAFYFSNPGHLKAFEIETSLTGYLTTFSEKFVKQHFEKNFFTQFPFLVEATTPVIDLEETTLESLVAISEQMLQAYNTPSPQKQAMLSHYLSIILLKTKEILLDERRVIHPTRRDDEIFIQFKQLLTQNFVAIAAGELHKVYSVREFAEQLHLHPNYLNQIIKKTTGQPPIKHIQARTLTEAEGLLTNSNKTVSEIAHLLGFTDTTHFSKFFKKHTNQTPLQYRTDQQL